MHIFKTGKIEYLYLKIWFENITVNSNNSHNFLNNRAALATKSHHSELRLAAYFHHRCCSPVPGLSCDETG
ncbi:hypothetical protein T01_15992 [Trichinella spiralis]|uniref:Uncharacterized protein n=1 Tax=Trichinella spiralis TaxID=6334 RepID=A0A0V1AUS3_TRISP|nr:hypothetical protein T01_15992 [Trichinella spiralis]